MLYEFKKREFKRREEPKEDDDDDDDEAPKKKASDSDSDDDMEFLERMAVNNNNNKAKKKKKDVVRLDLSDDDDEGEVEALAPAMKIADSDSDDEPDVVDLVDEDEATARRQKLLREAREAREELVRAEREGELREEDDSDDDDDVEIVDEAPTTKSSSSKQVRLKFRCGDEVTSFSTGDKDPLSTIFAAFAKDRGVDVAECSFDFDGQKLDGRRTPARHDMDDDDLVDAKAPPRTKPKDVVSPLFEEEDDQDDPSPPAAAPPAPAATKRKNASPSPPKKKRVLKDEKENKQQVKKKTTKQKKHKIVIHVKLAGEKKTKHFAMYDQDAFAKALAAFAEKKKVNLDDYDFTIDGNSDKIDLQHTPADLGIHEDLTVVANAK